MRLFYLPIIVVVLISFSGCYSLPSQVPDNIQQQELSCIPKASTTNKTVYSMKGVGIDLPDDDFTEMKKAGIDIISTEWGMEEDIDKARVFLDKVYAAGLKAVMDGGFSYTAWGFTENDWDRLPRGKRPVWQKEKVQAWIKALKDHPAIYAWDISNEFGENLPSGVAAKNTEWPATRITTEQLKRAKADVLAIDPGRPIHARMYEWDEEVVPEHVKGLLENRIADIISLNLYSNYLEDGELQWPDVIKDVGASRVAGIKKMAPGTIVWLSLAAFEYHGLFGRPTVVSLNRDFQEALKIRDLDGISFFCWGPVDQWDPSCNWYLPETGADLWDAIQKNIRQSQQGK
ncbi:MAG: hypothetical protein PHO26_03415 [Dehalococcoidia bacterium]|nr:hypothetical protein [Dehalococcoidia bacterium]MDD5495092.1 hypothetical protein [Dehalococcoidia bacterium]